MRSGLMVKAALEDKGMTQVELARRLGKGQALISKYLSGKIEVSDTVGHRIAEMLDIDSEEFITQLQCDKFKRLLFKLGMQFPAAVIESFTHICRNCEFWTPGLVSKVWDQKAPSKNFGGCSCKAIEHEITFPDGESFYNASRISHLITEYDEEWGAIMGAEFGCVHWRLRPE